MQKWPLLPSFLVILVSCLSDVSPYSFNHDTLNDALLRERLALVGSGLVDYVDEEPQSMPVGINARAGMPAIPPSGTLDYDTFALSPSLRDREYLSHSSLFGNRLHDFGEPGEGIDRFKPGTATKTATELKADGVLPSYCNPPNPCPIGYTSKDGCLEDFENSAPFSRDYQSMQECMCDTEHMFNCPDSTRDSEITALSRSLQNEGSLGSTLDKIMEELDLGEERVVAKKFSQKKNHNPYLEGERLPIAAKKGVKW